MDPGELWATQETEADILHPLDALIVDIAFINFI